MTTTVTAIATEDHPEGIVTKLVRAELGEDLWVEEPPNRPIEVVTSAVLKVLAREAWQLDERVFAEVANPKAPEQKAGPPDKPTWRDVAIWLAKAVPGSTDARNREQSSDD